MDEKKKLIAERLQSAAMAVIKQQIEEKDPKETLETLERLMEEGFSEEEAYRLIGQLVSMEVAEMFAGTGSINMERYIDALGQLPEPFRRSKTELDEDED